MIETTFKHYPIGTEVWILSDLNKEEVYKPCKFRIDDITFELHPNGETRVFYLHTLGKGITTNHRDFRVFATKKEAESSL